jgi:hypothetical protein
MSAAFDQYVFAADMQLNAISDPIRDDTVTTKGGYWLVKVVSVESGKDITTEDRDQLKTLALKKWSDALLADPSNKIVNHLDDDKKSWALGKVFYG